MKREQLIDHLNRRLPQLTSTEAKEAVVYLIKCLKGHLMAENTIEIRNFGVFSVKKRNSKVIRNPKSGERFKLDNGYKTIRFKPGLNLKKEVSSL